MSQLIQDLAVPGDELVETHISWVLLRSDDVYKIKKPVSLGFLDFSTLELRRAACEAERELNERLAPGVYRACVPITRDDQGRHRLGGEGETVEWAVHMARMPSAERSDIRLAERRLDAGHLEQIARKLSVFHASARCDEETARFGSLEVISANVEENFEQTRGRLDRYLDASAVAEIEAWQCGFLEAKADLFEARRRHGKVRDGHGDLRLEHVYLRPGGEVVVLDCIEFNHRFRFADVCADIAFLAMDLAWHDRSDLAEQFLAAYAREADDYEFYRLVDFYESYRAFVRGKVALISAETKVSHAAREATAGEARKYFLLSQASERRALLPARLIVVAGTIAAGKSTVAAALGARLSIPVLEADRTRKSMLGLAATEPLHTAPWSGPYSHEGTESTYGELFLRADAVLSSGRSVVIDASFRSRAMRHAAARAARRQRVPFLFVECRASRALCRQRLRDRARSASTSDGRLEIFDEFQASWEPVDEIDESQHLILDTALPVEANIERVLERLGLQR